MHDRIRLTLLALATLGAFFTVAYLYKTGPQAAEKTWDDRATRMPRVPIMVDARGFAGASVEAVEMWNDAAGFDLFALGTGGVMVKSDDGEPCGNPWRPASEWGHAATAYECPPSWPFEYEILVSFPGDEHNQLCIIAHELGHVLGLGHDSRGVMGQGCAAVVRVNDKDRKALRERFKPTT
jgi:predicted Zn-dependent protease